MGAYYAKRRSMRMLHGAYTTTAQQHTSGAYHTPCMFYAVLTLLYDMRVSPIGV